MSIKTLAEQYNDYILDRRHFYHQYPELSFKEEKTTEYIVEDLKKLGLEVETFDGLFGCVGILKGGKPGGTVVLRADIDALPVEEKTGLPFASKNPGVMHACGHDNHIAMQLGAAKILCDMKDEIAGTVKFLFQAGEETAVGARFFVEKGVMKGVDACFGMHIWGQLDAPKFSIQGGARMASCDKFTINVKGKTSHGSAPHLGADAVVASAAIIMALQGIVSRINNPLNPLVVTVGTINAGQRWNIISGDSSFEGTVRTYDREFRKEIEALINGVAQNTAKCYGCTAELNYEYLTGPVINDKEEVLQVAQNAAVSLFGEDILTNMEKVTGSEDFAYFMEEVPSVYTFLGGRNESIKGSGYANHHEEYTVDEVSLHYGAAVAAQFAFDFLAKKAAK